MAFFQSLLVVLALFLTYNSCVFGQYTCYGDFMTLNPTGAGARTSRAWSLNVTGAKASHQIAARELASIRSMWAKFKKTADSTCIDPALIAALAGRESDVGRELTRCKGWGDCRGSSPCTGCRAWGILQCDIYSSGIGTECRKLPWDSQELMELVVKRELIDKIKCVQNKMKTWSKAQQLQGGVAAYNFGCSNVKTWAGLDIGTANGDYSNDVMARAQWIKKNI